MEYHTRYPKSVVMEGDAESVELETRPEGGIEQLHIVTGEVHGRLCGIFDREGFVKVRFEHKQPSQLGGGLSLRLGKPWEMHVRLSSMGDNVMIHAEVEVSRDYMQHLFSQRTPVVYEVARILEKNNVGYRMWSGRMGRYVASVTQDYRVRLATPSLPTFAWKPMVFSIGAVGVLYLAKYVATIWR